MASDAEKPDGFVVLTREQACERFAGTSPGLIPGIGPKTVARLRRGGVETLAQLAAADGGCARAGLRRRSRSWLGARRFEDDRDLELERIRKSESRETTFDRDLRGLAELEPPLVRLSEQLCERSARRGRAGGRSGSRSASTTSPRTRARERSRRQRTSRHGPARGFELLRELDPPRPVRLLGVRVAGLDAGRAVPEELGQLELGG